MSNSIVIVGGGHAAAQLCSSLVDAGQGARVVLVCEEPSLPYQRPPLSKGFLKSADEAVQLHRAEAWYQDAGVTLHTGDLVTGIDRERRVARLRSGGELPYEWLVLATGVRARRLPDLPASLGNVLSLRDIRDAQQLRDRLTAAQNVTVLGGGFIGLEVAATAKALGKAVTVLESAPRLLARAVSPELSAHALAVHTGNGIDVRLDAQVSRFELDGDRVAAVTVNGQREPVELLLLSIGAVPETTLAEAAGLVCNNGIEVDEFMRTSDPHILAVGDCTSFPDHRAGRTLRLESVQNANDQARTAAATLAGQPRPHDALAWFWSDQGVLRLQMAGLAPAADAPGLVRHRRPGANDNSFSIWHYLGDTLVCVEAVNAPMDHMMSRKLLDARKSPAPEQVRDPAVALKTLL